MTDTEVAGKTLGVALRWLIVENIAIYAAIAAITIGGAWLTGTMWGLISLWMLTCLNTDVQRITTKITRAKP